MLMFKSQQLLKSNFYYEILIQLFYLIQSSLILIKIIKKFALINALFLN
jgi:hypothetical protein